MADHRENVLKQNRKPKKYALGELPFACACEHAPRSSYPWEKSYRDASDEGLQLQCWWAGKAMKDAHGSVRVEEI